MRAHAAAAIVYGALTLALTWPLAAELGAVVPHDLGDPLLSTWTLWWNAHVMPFTARWWDGLAFYPAKYTLALSDHRVGLGLITTPLIWWGASPLTSHNLAFLATFFLSALAAYVLCWRLTGSAAAAFVGGAVFGFNPFRAEHLPHLELLAAYWLPIVFLALHEWTRTRRRRWLALLSVALTMQALTGGYYFFYAGVVIGLWLVWFLPRRAPSLDYARVALALGLPLLVMLPILLTYQHAHQLMGLGRSIDEIETYSADVIGLITAPELLALWNTPREWLRAEGAIFPGATAVALTIAAVLRAPRTKAERSRRGWRTGRRALLSAAAAMFAVALLPWFAGPLAFTVGELSISLSAAHKPLSIAVLFFAVWALTSDRVRAAWHRQSVFAFYVLATIAIWVLALGPTPRMFGERLLYKAPYAWLMLLPGFDDGFRAPARFAMIAALTLSIAAALAFQRMAQSRARRPQLVLLSLVSFAIIAESWIEPFPLARVPEPLELPSSVPADAAIAELPFDGFEDAIAMYHSTMHRRPTLNGLSGYDPPHQVALRAAFRDGAYDALLAAAEARDVAVFVDRRTADPAVGSMLTAHANARALDQTRTHLIYLLPRAGSPLPPAVNDIVVRGVTGSEQSDELPRMLDDDRVSAWSSSGPQNGDEWIAADLGAAQTIAAVTLGSGGHVTSFPRELAIDLSVDGVNWSPAWRGRTAALAVAAAIDDPLQVPVTIRFAPAQARYVRIAQVGRSHEPWAIAELAIAAPAPERPPL